eukprot:273296_1
MATYDKFDTPQYDVELEHCVQFLESRIQGEAKYVDQLQEIANHLRTVLKIELDDVSQFGADGDLLCRKICSNVLRYVDLFSVAIDRLMPEPTVDIENLSTIDVLMESRENMLRNSQQDAVDNPQKRLPKELTRRYEVYFEPPAVSKELSVRQVEAEHIGKLVTVTGMVTRISDVKSLLRVGTYTCDACGYENYQTISSMEYMPLTECQAEECKNLRKTGDKLHMQTRGSRFLQFQEMVLQECADQVPAGSIPRSMKIYLHGAAVRQCTSGDKVSVTGVFIPTQATGFRAMKQGLTTATVLEGMSVHREKKSYKESAAQDDELIEQIQDVCQDPDMYNKLARSIAPEIFGNLDVKKAMLLTMVSGVTKETVGGLKVRGDINVLLVGDPGVAKSQLLKHISVIAPRAVYTTGKGSSGVGLTAAVIRDQNTNEMVLEAGALVLADMGICCIDEFDKMEEADRTAIHEVMEQQSVSIAKAGICTTLNARAAVLAAANPIYGRYNQKKTVEENIQLPAALLSRFDLLFVLVDTPDRDYDVELAMHICHVHQHKKHPPLEFEPFSPAFLRAYIAEARKHEPWIPRTLTDAIVDQYVEMRDRAKEMKAKHLLPTPRSLLSILRLSQALARLRMVDSVELRDVEEATRMMTEAKKSMFTEEDESRNEQDATSRIYHSISEFMEKNDTQRIKLSDILPSLTLKGFSRTLIDETLGQYEEMDVWMYNKEAGTITLTDNSILRCA